MQIVPDFGSAAVRPPKAAPLPAGTGGGGFGALMAGGDSGRAGPGPAAPVIAARTEDSGTTPGSAASEEDARTDAAGTTDDEASAVPGSPIGLASPIPAPVPSSGFGPAVPAGTELPTTTAERPETAPTGPGARGPSAVAAPTHQPDTGGPTGLAMPLGAAVADRLDRPPPDASPTPAAGSATWAGPSPALGVSPPDRAAGTGIPVAGPAGMEPASPQAAIPDEDASGPSPAPAPAPVAATGLQTASSGLLQPGTIAPAPAASAAVPGPMSETAARRVSATLAAADATAAAGGPAAAAATMADTPQVAQVSADQDARGFLMNVEARGPEGQPPLGTASGPSAATAASGPAAAPQPGGAAPALLAPQLAVAARRLPDGPVELHLDPAELGRVTLTLVPAEAGLHVSVQAERSETLDLLRRSIGLLEQELRDLGYANTGFSFGEERRPRDRPGGAAGAGGSDTVPASGRGPDLARPAPSLPTVSASLDLRL